ncbi:MAG: PA2778 family cysteine peptidase [Thiomicrospira sp.]|uniref:PA2778 family cysteine peptidase n=1 Tax=Thiomicrospira sp. TaxID=935 RepID=UPI001A084475|nr:PA2778 family cysteine peptidase [Thiomicrospira sp.]MBE0493076.1 PA2778 family cysteine peptidase [Thiomicrospira sp.]
MFSRFNAIHTQLRLGVLFMGILGLSVLTGCATSPQTQQLITQPSATFKATELTAVPFFPQTEYQCGPAALATVMQYRGREVFPDDLVSQVYIPEKKGSLQIEMIAATRKQGLMPYPLAPKLSALLSEVDGGNPVLVMQNLGLDWFPVWHYAVVVGYDLAEQQLVLRSAETKRWISDLSTFERTWQRSNYWALVMVKPDQLPATAEPAAWLKTAFELEQVGQTTAAAQAYQAGLTQWPDSFETGLALTNLHYNQKNFSQAGTVFESMVSQHGSNAILWNNWAYNLKAQSCIIQAKQAAACGLKRQPELINIQSTWSEMQTLSEKTQAANCPVIKCD